MIQCIDLFIHNSTGLQSFVLQLGTVSFPPDDCVSKRELPGTQDTIRYVYLAFAWSFCSPSFPPDHDDPPSDPRARKEGS